MGLLSHISNSASNTKQPESVPVKKVGSGLLAKAQKATEKTFSSLQELAITKGFKHCAIFTPVHGMMVITEAVGLDSQTVANSVSSKDFWKGIFKTSNVLNYSKADNEMYNFLQFFSFELKSLIQHISFLKINSSADFSVLFVFNTDNKSVNLTESLSQCIKFNTTSKKKLITAVPSKVNHYLYNVNYSDLALNSIKTIQLPEENIRRSVLSCIDEEVFELFVKAFPSPAAISCPQQGKIKLALTAPVADEMLFQAHINLLLKSVLDHNQLMPEVTSAGKAKDSDSILKFLEN